MTKDSKVTRRRCVGCQQVTVMKVTTVDTMVNVDCDCGTRTVVGDTRTMQ